MEKYNLPRYAMDAILTAPYQFMFTKMREQKYHTFYHQHLGRFVVKEGWKRWALTNWDKRMEAKERKKEMHRLLKLALKDKRDELNRQSRGDLSGMVKPDSEVPEHD